MATSLIYKSASIYEGVMLLLYGRHYFDRYSMVADLIPDQATVLELCCGPARLFRRHLRSRIGGYRGLDVNPRFIDRVVRWGGEGQVWDLNSDHALPRADCVIMQASLYHFLPDPRPVVDRMLRAAGRQVIIAEPIQNLSDSRFKLLGRLARHHTNAGAGGHNRRFNESSLDDFFSNYAGRVARSLLIPGGREKIYVLTA